MEDKEIRFEKYHSPYLVDQGYGFRKVQYKAWRVERPYVFGYGMTEKEAIYDLTVSIQPL